MELTVNQVFESWIGRARSESAKKNYSNTLHEFFALMFDKSINDITISELEEILPISVYERYETVLKSKGLQNSTIKYKYRVVSQFFNKLQVNRVFPTLNYGMILDSAISSSHIKNDSSKTKVMTIEDKDNFKSWLETERYTSARYAYKGVIYSTLVEFLYVTGARLSATFNVKWTDIKKQKDSFGNEMYVVHILDKGDKLNKYPITNEFYNELVKNLSQENEFLFNEASQRNFSNDMKQFAEDMGIEEDSFTPHSLRSLAITEVYDRTLDIVKAKDFAKHESVDTTVGYIQRRDNFTDSGSYLLSGKEATLEDIEDLTKEELLEIISSKKDILNYIYYKKQGVIK